MKLLDKKPGKPFVILNLTDTHLETVDIAEKTPSYECLIHTVRELTRRVKPDLITHTGDFSSDNDPRLFDFYRDFLDSLQIPWAFVWGNHDAMYSEKDLCEFETRMMKSDYCLYEPGDKALGHGNYTVGITENGRPVEALFFMDTHDRIPYKDDLNWARLEPDQLAWYRDQVTDLKARGFEESALFMHIPCYAYRTVSAEHFKLYFPTKDISEKAYWVDHPEGSFGEQNEYLAAHPEEDGVLNALEEAGHTRLVVVGHNHTNNWMIWHHGIRFLYALKTGIGSFCEPHLCGGTVITVGSHGIEDVHHEYCKKQLTNGT